ncbi:MAG TPA: hypothetical protein VFL13_13205 [Candidatus Baltobacteraceae bacterium]|nr:hypothetical protein [Candidatus Baltobacteraceae bacterium]
MLAAASAAAAFACNTRPASAIVLPTPPPPPRVEPTSTPTGTPNSTVLPLNSSLFFVLDDTVSSHTKPGTIARAHLRDAIVLDGHTVAPAGSPVQIVVTQSSAAQVGNVDGTVEMYFKDLELAGGRTLALVTPRARINPRMTAGQESTQEVTDTVGDIFVPGHMLWHALRKGSDVTLRPGTVVRARTAAVLSIAHGVLAINTPPPFATVSDTPHPSFEALPLATPPGFVPKTPKPKATVTPAPTATP